jgi:hypothetical protein
MKALGKTLLTVVTALTLTSCYKPSDINKDGVEDIIIVDDLNNPKYVKLSAPNGIYETCKIIEFGLPRHGGSYLINSKRDKGYYNLNTKAFIPYTDHSWKTIDELTGTNFSQGFE